MQKGTQGTEEDDRKRKQESKRKDSNGKKSEDRKEFKRIETKAQRHEGEESIILQYLTPSPVILPSLLFNPRYFFKPEELLLPRKQIHSPYSSSTTLFNSSQNQTCNLVSPSSLVYTSIPPQVFEIGKCSDKMYLKHHEKQVEDILNYLDELYLHRIERMEEGCINGNELKTELKEIRIQIIKLQK
ncbi:hypothetical protein Tco_0548568 [Tanacetum coccineum]